MSRATSGERINTDASKVTHKMSNSDDDVEEYLDVDDGCGCAEVWDELSERRRDTASGSADAAADD